jgi:hypothetical protein
MHSRRGLAPVGMVCRADVDKLSVCFVMETGWGLRINATVD